MKNLKKTILIIDDDPKNLLALSAVLKAKEFPCITTQHAREGLKILVEKSDIDIVLMDMMMPDMDGYEALEYIRSNHVLKNIPVISVTAQAMDGDREKCLEWGANEYISKPIDVDLLLNILENF